MSIQHYVPRRRAITRSLGAAFIVLICAVAGLRAQVFEWTKQGGGPGWKRGNAIAVDYMGNTLIAGEVGQVPGSPATPAVNFHLNPITPQGVADAFVVMYDETGTFVWQLVIKGESNTGSVVAKSIAVRNNSLYIVGDFDGTLPNLGLTSPPHGHPGSSFLAKYTYDPVTGSTPTLAWIATAGPDNSTDGTIRYTGVALDGAGNPYVCGTMDGIIGFTKEGTTTYEYGHKGYNRLIAVKYLADGTWTWLRHTQEVQISSLPLGHAYGNAIAISQDADGDGIGEVIVTGNYTGQININGSHYQANAAAGDFIVVRWDTYGAPQGVERPDNNCSTCPPYGGSTGRSVAIDEAATPPAYYVTGTFNGPIKVNSSPLVSEGEDYVLIKYLLSTTSGGAIWSRQSNTGKTGDAIANDVVARNGKIFVTGAFSGGMKIGGTSGNLVWLGSLGNHDVFVATYDQNGTALWAQRAGNILTAANRNYYDQGRGIDLHTNGKVYIVGEFGGDNAATGDARFFGTADLKDDHYRNVFTARISTNAVKKNGLLFNDMHTPTSMDDKQIIGHPVTVSKTGLGSDHVRTDPDGRYTIWEKQSGDVTILPVPNPFGTFSPEPEVPGFRFTPMSDTTDLRVEGFIRSTEYAVRDSTVRYAIRYTNIGTREVNTAILTFTPSSWLTPVSVVTDGLGNPTQTAPNQWIITNLPTFGSGEILITLRVGAVPINTQLTSQVAISQSQYPEPTGNNQTSIIQIVVQPSDPNLKSVMPEGRIGVASVRNGMSLTYRIDFFNVGAGPARMVTIYDTLDPHIAVTDDEEINIITGSPISPSILSFTAPHLALRFNPADLASVFENTAASHGYAILSVPLDPNVSIGTLVRNRAGIVFDDEAQILTNQVENCIAPDFTASRSCAGEPVQFTSFTAMNEDYLWSEPGAVREVFWSFGDGKGRSSDRNPVYTYGQPGRYVVTVTFRLNGGKSICGIVDSVYTFSKTIDVAAKPTPQISLVSNTLVSTPAAGYKWFRDSVFTGDTGRVLTISERGTYYVEATNGGMCSGRSNSIIITTNSVDAVSAYGSMVIRPNPGSGIFHLDLGRPADGDIRISVFDILGRTIHSDAVSAGNNGCGIDLSGLPSGLYMAHIDIDGDIVTRTIVLQR